MPFAPGTRFGSYEVVALIGVGGMGEVYRAVDTNLKRSVAIKVLPPLFAADAEWLVRFQREAETLAALNHQNIAHVYGLERIDGTAGLVMELVDGPTLADRIVQGKVPLAEALSIAAQIADALEVAHERGIVHRDLKPANVKVRADGAVKVLDFGIAKSLLTAPGASGSHPTKVANTPTMTQLGMILGTAAYMSPEQARGKPVDRRTDVWAFGCVLYEMLVGKAAFEGEDAAATIGRVLEREVDMSALPPGVPAAVRQTLAACLQKDAKKRVRDLGDVKLALEGAFETRETAAAPRAGARPAWRRVGVPAAAFAAGAAAFALAAWRVAPPPEPPTVTRLSMPVASGSVVPQVSIARDGKRIAFWPGDSPAIRVRELDAFEWRTVAGAVPAEGNNGNAGCFSPDGAWLAFATGNALRRIALAGGAPLTVARDLAGADWCDWGDDGNLYFGSSAGIMRVPASGGAAEVVAAPSAEGGESYGLPQLLPGGKQLLFNVFRTADVQTARVDVLNLATRERKTLLERCRHRKLRSVARRRRARLSALWTGPVAVRDAGRPRSPRGRRAAAGRGRRHLVRRDRERHRISVRNLGVSERARCGWPSGRWHADRDEPRRNRARVTRAAAYLRVTWARARRRACRDLDRQRPDDRASGSASGCVGV